jgi:hypothetical protein
MFRFDPTTVRCDRDAVIEYNRLRATVDVQPPMAAFDIPPLHSKTAKTNRSSLMAVDWVPKWWNDKQCMEDRPDNGKMHFLVQCCLND